jgi:hypothetical protein
MTTTTLHLTTTDLCVLLAGIAAAQAEALEAEFRARDEIERRGAAATGDILSAMYHRLRAAEEALRIRMAPPEDPQFATWHERIDAAPDMDYPPGKVRPPRPWPAPPEDPAFAARLDHQEGA